jgi:hypothetical protein
VLTYIHSLRSTILNDNVNQFEIGLELDKGYFTLKIKSVNSANTSFRFYQAYKLDFAKLINIKLENNKSSVISAILVENFD